MSFILLGILNAQAEAAAVGDFELIESEILDASASSVTFDNLDTVAADYKHLQIRMVMGRDNDATALADQNMQVNSDTGSNYAWHYLQGDGSSVSSSAGTSQTSITIPEAIARNTGAGVYASTVMDILDFGDTSKNTTFRWLSGGITVNEKKVFLGSGLYADTSAITSISFINTTAAGSRYSLYGLRAG